MFSAINSGFLAFSIPMLSDDPAAQTNNLLKLLIQGANNSTLTAADLAPPSFTPTSDGVHVNQLFSLSLSLSILASFGALLGQQWIICYRRQTPAAYEGRRWDLERKFEGAKRWQLAAILEVLLPTLLQAALFLFMIGFIIFFRNLSAPVGLSILVVSVIGGFAFFVSVLCSVWDPFCPFQTPLPALCISSLRYLVDAVGRGFDLARGQNSQTSAWARIPTIRRSALSQEDLLVKSICRTLETSVDDNLLKATAINIPFLSDSDLIANSPYNVPRLSEILTRHYKGSDEDDVYAIAIAYLLIHKRMKTSEDIPSPSWTQWHAAMTHVQAPLSQVSVLPSSIALVASMLEFDTSVEHHHLQCAEFLEKASDVVANKWCVAGILGRALLHSEGHREVLDELGLNLISTSPGATEITLNAAYFFQKLFDDIE